MRPFFYTIVLAAVCVFSTQELAAETRAPPTPSVIGQPSRSSATKNTTAMPVIISMKCDQAFMPISPADLYAMNLTEPTQPIPKNISTVPAEAACKSFADPSGGFCNPKSCVGFPVAYECNEIFVQGLNKTAISNVTIAQVACQGNYFKPSANDTEKKTLCTDKDQRSYSCTGQCIGLAECSECVSISDPAIRDLGSVQD